MFADAALHEGFSVSVRSYAVPVYFADKETPVYDVRLTADWAPWQLFGPVPIPDGALPDPQDDGHMVIVDRQGGCTYEFWQARRVGKRWAASWANAISLESDGFYPRGGGARAGGSALLAGLVWPDALEAGRIDHALAFAYGLTRAGGPVPPATASDGWSDDPRALPLGARLQLDPAFNISTLPAWQQPIARALQEYGMYLVDTTGGDVSLFAVHPYSFDSEDPYDRLIPPEAWFGDTPGAQEWARLDIPPERFRVLRMPAQRPNPETLSPPACGRTAGEWMRGVWDVAVDGSYLFLAAGVDGLLVVDAARPDALSLVAAFPGDEDEEMEPAISVAVADGRAYVGTDGSGLWTVDVSTPDAPRLAGRFGEEEELAVLGLLADGPFLYVAAEQALYTLERTPTGVPRPVGALEAPEVLDAPRHMARLGAYLLVADPALGLTAIDVSTPQRPLVAGQWEAFVEGVTVLEDRVYVTEHALGLTSLDAQLPGDFQIIGAQALPDLGFGLTARDGIVYVANGLAGLHVAAIPPSGQPALRATLDLGEGYARDVALDARGYVYVAMQDGGLAAVDVTIPSTPRVVDHFMPEVP
ncbi:MAG: hypothetical protein Q9O62_14070 [Ardenticatenia bacterium]|nr:hypothetical protein [Ardenticatenia bacterium]